ncbi:hypothetical protein ACB098_06G219500 [Castanea mollissima]
MANQPTPARPWFRLASIARPAAPTPIPTPAPAPAPAPAQAPEPRPPLVIRPTFRPLAPSQPTQPQEPTPPPPATAPPASTVAPPASAVAPPPAAALPRSFAAPIPTPAPAPAPGPVVTARPIFATSSVPSSPVQRASAPAAPSFTMNQVPVVSQPQTRVSAPSSSVQTSPVTKAVPSSSSVRTSPIAKEAPTQAFPNVKAATTSYDTTTIKPAAQTPPQSPKPKPTAPPPSPLNLPPTRLKAETETEQRIPLEAEQKTVLVQKTIEKPKPWLGGIADSQWEHSEHYKPSYVHSGKHEEHKEVEIKEKGSYKKLSDSEEAGTRVITIAGENKGAFMELIRSPKKHDGSDKSNSLQVKKGITTTGIQGSDSESYSSSDKEGKPKKDKSHKGANTVPMSAFMNSNVQGKPLVGSRPRNALMAIRNRGRR